jgi:hypothetical protein
MMLPVNCDVWELKHELECLSSACDLNSVFAVMK